MMPRRIHRRASKVRLAADLGVLRLATDLGVLHINVDISPQANPYWNQRVHGADT